MNTQSGLYLKKARKRSGERQGDVAKSVGITQTYLSLLERGHNSGSVDVFKRLADHYGIPLPVLLWGWSGDKSKGNRYEKETKQMLDRLIEELYFNEKI